MNWKNELETFKEDYPDLCSFLGTQSKNLQLSALKLMANEAVFQDDYPSLSGVVLRTNVLTADLFENEADPDVDMDQVMCDIEGLVNDSDDLIALFPDAFEEIEDLNAVAQEEDTLNSTSDAYTYAHGGADGFSVSGNTRDEFVSHMVETLRTRRSQGYEIPDTFRNLSDDAVRIVSGSLWDNRDSGMQGRVQSSSTKKPVYGI